MTITTINMRTKHFNGQRLLQSLAFLLGHRFCFPLFFAVVAMTCTSCNGQSSKPVQSDPGNARKAGPVGGACETCELMYVGMPDQIQSIDTSTGWNEKGQQLVVEGRAFKPDGKTPAAGIIIYYWQTDNNGLYSSAPGLNERVKRHGHIRGWLKTDAEGRYTLYTIRPAPYPRENMPAHIHLLVKEPDIDNEYYIDELQFDDDHFLTAEKRAKLENRAGTGIVKVEKENGRQVAKHKITLGMNIPGYPE